MTHVHSQEVLVVPREVVSNLRGFVSWNSIDQATMATLEESCDWWPRSTAELSTDFVQLISCAVVRDVDGRYSVTRRTAAARKDLHWKFTLLYGGHVERVGDNLELTDLLKENMLRELQEEIGVDDVDRMAIIGTVNDLTTLTSSRHVAVVFDVSISDEISVQAGEEFSLRSKHCGEFLDSTGLASLAHRFDPWSKLLLHSWINPNHTNDSGMQLGFMMNTEE